MDTDGIDKDCEHLIMDIQGRFLRFSFPFLAFLSFFFFFFSFFNLSCLWSVIWLLSGSGSLTVWLSVALISYPRCSGFSYLYSYIYLLLPGFFALLRVFPDLGFFPLSLHRRRAFFPIFFLRGVQGFHSLYFIFEYFFFFEPPFFYPRDALMPSQRQW
jgi:hypothetical protein